MQATPSSRVQRDAATSGASLRPAAPARPQRDRRWPFSRQRTASIGVLTISGVIDDKAALSLLNCFQQVAWHDQNVVGLVLRIASEGGSLAAAQSMVQVIEQLRNEQGLAVAVAIDDIAISAAFYLALAGDFVAAQPAATLGSVGSRIRRYDATALLDRLGVQDVSVSSSLNKGAESSWVTAAGHADPALAQPLVDDIHAQFVDWMKLRRGIGTMPPELVDGRMFSGKVALAHGLVDAAGGTAQAIAHIAGRSAGESFSLLHIDYAAKASAVESLLGAIPFGPLIGRLLGIGR
jgi:protease-4